MFWYNLALSKQIGFFRKRLTLTTILVLSCSLAWSAAFEGDDEKMKVFEFYAGIAGAAGLVQKCGMSNLDSKTALAKIATALRCEYNDGVLTSEDADAMMKGMAFFYANGEKANPNPEICETVTRLVTKLLKTTDC